MNKFILITIGDIKGIGIEILIKLWLKKKIKKFILITNIKILKKYIFNKNIDFYIINNDLNKKNNYYQKNKLLIYNINALNEDINTFNSLLAAKYLIKKYNFYKIITLPINKYIIAKKFDKNFIGQTEYFQNIEKNKYSNMIFIKNDLIITTLSTHVQLKKINNHLFKNNFYKNKLSSLQLTLKNDFNIKQPKILISGLNPHSGENNLFGNEENKFIKPVIKKLNERKIKFYGPISGDSMLLNNNIKKYHCFVFNYHDQALIPFKLLSKNKGVNFTSGLKLLRVSPDHGTAYDIVGKNLAKYDSLYNCFKLINKISKNREKIADS